VLPELLSPSLHTLPTAVSDANTLARFPQLHLLLNKTRRDLLRLRHIIEVELQRCLNYWGFIKVTTPVLAADTGGAIARPFCTTSIEYPQTQLKLRIAQELGLKKLVAADLGRVYEIGPVFRNEGKPFPTILAAFPSVLPTLQVLTPPITQNSRPANSIDPTPISPI